MSSPEERNEQRIREELYAIDDATGLRAWLNLPPDATEEEVDQAADFRNHIEVRELFGLPFEATEAEVDAAEALRSHIEVREMFGLPFGATEAEVDAAERNHLGY